MLPVQCELGRHFYGSNMLGTVRVVKPGAVVALVSLAGPQGAKGPSTWPIYVDGHSQWSTPR